MDINRMNNVDLMEPQNTSNKKNTFGNKSDNTTSQQQYFQSQKKDTKKEAFERYSVLEVVSKTKDYPEGTQVLMIGDDKTWFVKPHIGAFKLPDNPWKRVEGGWKEIKISRKHLKQSNPNEKKDAMTAFMAIEAGNRNAEDYFDHSMLAYNFFAQSLTNPIDPFVDIPMEDKLLTGHRKKVIKNLQNQDGNEKKKTVPVGFDLERIKNKDAVYSETKGAHNLFNVPDKFKDIRVTTKDVEEKDKQTGVSIPFQWTTGNLLEGEGEDSFGGMVTYVPATSSKPIEIVIAFRGSRSGAMGVTYVKDYKDKESTNADWRTDLSDMPNIPYSQWSDKAKARPDLNEKMSPNMVHIGFRNAYYSAAEEIKNIIDKMLGLIKPPTWKINITTTGHSLGGGVAQVALMDLKESLQEKLKSKNLEANFHAVPVSAPIVFKKTKIPIGKEQKEQNRRVDNLQDKITHLGLYGDMVQSDGLGSFVHVGDQSRKYLPNPKKTRIGGGDPHEPRNIQEIVKLGNDSGKTIKPGKSYHELLKGETGEKLNTILEAMYQSVTGSSILSEWEKRVLATLGENDAKGMMEKTTQPLFVAGMAMNKIRKEWQINKKHFITDDIKKIREQMKLIRKGRETLNKSEKTNRGMKDLTLYWNEIFDRYEDMLMAMGINLSDIKNA